MDLCAAGGCAVFADWSRCAGGKDGLAQGRGAADAFLAAGQSGGARHDRELLQDGVQHGDPAQPAGSLWAQCAGHPHGHGAHPASDGPPEGQPRPHLPVCLRLFQRGIHGLPAHLGPVWCRGPALRQRLCHGVQYPALDHGLRHGQRQQQPKGHCPQPAAHTGALCHGGGPFHLSAADPGSHPHRPAAFPFL